MPYLIKPLISSPYPRAGRNDLRKRVIKKSGNGIDQLVDRMPQLSYLRRWHFALRVRETTPILLVNSS